MLDRRRREKGYGAVPQEEEDLEMAGQGTGVSDEGQERGPDDEGSFMPSGGAGAGTNRVEGNK